MNSLSSILIPFLFISACINKSANPTKEIHISSPALGQVDRSYFEKEDIAEWHKEAYNGYVPREETIKKIKPLFKDIQLEVFFGEWCSDSQREIPAFHKILDQADILNLNIKYISLDEDKKEPGNSQSFREVEYVPSFIFFREMKEIGRIVESPMKSLEEDMYNILSK